MIVFQGRRNDFFIFILLFLLIHIQAGYSKNGVFFSSSLKHLQGSVAGGPSWYTTSNTHMVISSYEIDKNIITRIAMHGSWKIGLNYSLFEKGLKQNKYLNEVLFGLNVYQTSTSLYGMIWQYELPQFNNYNFKAPITSTRLMLDLRPSFFIWRATTSYAILGVGMTWNDVSYSETTAAAGITQNTALSLNANTLSQVAFDLGLGCKMAFTPYLNVSIEYLYAFLGRGYSDKSPGIQLAMAPSFLLQNQSLLFGLNIKV